MSRLFLRNRSSFPFSGPCSQSGCQGCGFNSSGTGWGFGRFGRDGHGLNAPVLRVARGSAQGETQRPGLGELGAPGLEAVRSALPPSPGSHRSGLAHAQPQGRSQGQTPVPQRFPVSGWCANSCAYCEHPGFCLDCSQQIDVCSDCWCLHALFFSSCRPRFASINNRGWVSLDLAHLPTGQLVDLWCRLSKPGSAEHRVPATATSTVDENVAPDQRQNQRSGFEDDSVGSDLGEIRLRSESAQILLRHPIHQPTQLCRCFGLIRTVGVSLHPPAFCAHQWSSGMRQRSQGWIADGVHLCLADKCPKHRIQTNPSMPPPPWLCLLSVVEQDIANAARKPNLYSSTSSSALRGLPNGTANLDLQVGHSAEDLQNTDRHTGHTKPMSTTRRWQKQVAR